MIPIRDLIAKMRGESPAPAPAPSYMAPGQINPQFPTQQSNGGGDWWSGINLPHFGGLSGLGDINLPHIPTPNFGGLAGLGGAGSPQASPVDYSHLTDRLATDAANNDHDMHLHYGQHGLDTGWAQNTPEGQQYSQAAAGMGNAGAPTDPMAAYEALLRQSFDPQFKYIDDAIAQLQGIYGTGKKNLTDKADWNTKNIGNVYNALDSNLVKNREGTNVEVAGNQAAAAGAFDQLTKALGQTYGGAQHDVGSELHRLGLAGAANQADTTKSDLAFLQGLAANDKAGTLGSMKSAQQGFNDLMNSNQSAAGMERNRSLTANQQHLQDNLFQLMQQNFQMEQPLLQQKAQLGSQMAQTLRQYMYPDPATTAQINMDNARAAAYLAKAGALSGGGGGSGSSALSYGTGLLGGDQFLQQSISDPTKLNTIMQIMDQMNHGQLQWSPDPKNIQQLTPVVAEKLQAAGITPTSPEGQAALRAMLIYLGKGGTSGNAALALGDSSSIAPLP